MRTSPPREGHLPSVPPAAPAPQTDVKRRRFLLALGAGGAASATAAAQVVAAPVVPAPSAVADDKSSGYRETDHVRTYYASTRL
mgnify:FL=1|jgi:hypothetical protein